MNKNKMYNILRNIFICISFIVVMFTVCFNLNFKAENTNDFNIKIIYQKDENKVIVNSLYKTSLKSVLLTDYNDSQDGVFNGWTPTELIEGVYEQAFAGWELIKINNTDITTTYFYPDNDYIYSNDTPFSDYEFNTELTLIFKPIYGKRIYLRDKYNFVNLNDVFGDNLDTAKINWDETTGPYSYSIEEANASLTDEIKNVGSSKENPVSNIDDAIALLGTNGGEIVTVNHYTFKNLDKYYDYYDGKKKSGTYNIYFGKNIKKGVITYTGLNNGFDIVEQGNETEKAYEKAKLGDKFETNYKNAHWYCLNTRGTEAANGHVFNMFFMSDTVLEDLNIVGYREVYKTDGSRKNAQVYFFSSANRRFVIMEGFNGFQRKTAESLGGADATNWGYASYKKNGTTYTQLTNSGKGFLQLYSGYNSKNTGLENLYITLYGNKVGNSFYDGFYHFSIVLKNGSNSAYASANVNNIHVYMSNFSVNSDFMGINQGTSNTFTCNHYGIYLFNFKNTSSNGFTSTVYNTKSTEIKDLVFEIDGDDTTQKLLSTYVGGMFETNGNNTSTVIIDDAKVIVKNKANITSLHGGGNQFAISTVIKNNFTMDIYGGTIGDLYGGCQGGAISADSININIYGGTISNVYGGGAGGLVTCYDSNSPLDLSTYKYSDDYKYFAFENNSSKYIYIEGFSIGLNRQVLVQGETSQNYDILTFQYIYPDGNSKTEINDYYNTSKNICVSNALVKTNNGININISGGNIKKDVYGGGLNGSVESNININVSSGIIGGNIYGGGSGQNTEFSAKEYFKSGSFYNGLVNNNYDIKYTSNKNAINSETLYELLASSVDTVYQNEIAFLQQNGYSDTFLNKTAKKIIQYSDLDKLNILQTDEFGNDYIEVYSDAIETLGSIVGDTGLNISGGTIKGSVFGGSDGHVAKITGNTNVVVSSGTIKGTVYGGGNVAVVTKNSNVEVSNATINDVYGGGNVGSINGSSTVTINNNAKITNVYAGCNQANIGESTNLIINNGKITNTYGGNNLSGLINTSINTTVNGGTITNLYGGGNYADTLLDTNVSVNGGTITNLYGGGNNAKINNSIINVNSNNALITSLYGGGFKGNVINNTYITLNNGKITSNLFGGGYEGNILGNTYIKVVNSLISNDIYGGGYEGNVLGDTYIEIYEESTVNNIYGGGYQGFVDDDTNILIDNGIVNNIYGGGYAGYILGNTFIKINYCEVLQNVYGGGYQGKVDNDTFIEIIDGNYQSIFGGGYEGNVENKTNITINDGLISKDIFGGGYFGAATYSLLTLNGGVVNGNVYGGGYSNNIFETVELNVNGGTYNQNIYGGGYEGNVLKDTYIKFNKGTVQNNIYGGGFIGTVNNTSVEIIEEDSSYGDILINGNVFGGGYGLTATVYESTNVIISLNLDIDVIEKLVNTSTLSEVASGESAVEVSFVDGYSFIYGSVYGGGDLGQIGKGTINTSNNTANITLSGNTLVSILDGYIGGSVFGGGSGIPKDSSYQLEMGTVYGSTKTIINGGYINKNVYGGGTQSRVYYSNLNNPSVTLATDVIIEETNKLIVINGSVFGGGDRGNSATTNASVHTTIGDVKVSINGSDIYFITGGVYGDGNLCLVKGERSIELNNFTTNEEYLKTFRSLQRANTVILNNSDIVLLGAVDLVEEGDNTVYSINRINNIILENGSTMKLDQIVKFLGQIESDYEFVEGDNTMNRKFIDHGNNGTNGYTSLGGQNQQPLTEDEIASYRDGSVSTLKNVICVANGLYLEIINEDNSYGMVKGLFTLALLRANEGEGGGFVYASIETSTGGFICETKYASNSSYMAIIGNVSGYNNFTYTYYCWFIQGNTITYSIDIEGYIGSDQTSYKEISIIPEHSENLYYILNQITVNSVLKNAVSSGKYSLVQRNSDLIEQEISLEIFIGNTSIGFLSYENNEWYINGKSGYHSNADDLIENLNSYNLGLLNIGNENNELNIVLHKSKEVNAEIQNMNVGFILDLYTNELQPFSDGTSTLKYSVTFSIIRLVPEQVTYSGNDKMYSGLSSSSVIKVTNGSSFTIEYQTRYIPIAFPKGTSEMYWMLSTIGYSYYMDELGNYLTIDNSGNVVNISPLLTFDSEDTEKILVEKNAHGEYVYTHDNKKINFQLIASYQSSYIPKGTKITMIDMSLAGSPTYYYYICEEDTYQLSLDDFFVMGTKTTLSNSSKIPEFKKLYYNVESSTGTYQEATRITERLIFVFDLEQVLPENYINLVDNVFNGNVILSHLYGESTTNSVDIMDFVKSDTKLDVKSYTRSTPKVVEYQINVNDTGIKLFDVEFAETEYNENEIAIINITVLQDNEYSNTQLKNGYIGVKIMVSGYETLPDGIEFRYNGIFLPKYGNKYLIVPILNYGEYSIEVVNNLGNIITNEYLSKAMFEASLCYLPDEQYFNDTVIKNNIIVDFDIECKITDKVISSLDVLVENSYIEYDNTEFNITVFESNTITDTTLKVYYLENNEQILTKAIYASKLIKGSADGVINTLHISDNVKKGIYLLVFNNNDKEVFVYLIIN